MLPDPYPIDDSRRHHAASGTAERLLLCRILPGLIVIGFLGLCWSVNSNSLQDDDYLQSFFVILQQLEAGSFRESLDALMWNYFQHKGLFGKLVVLLLYYLTGEAQLRWLNLLGNFTLVTIALLLVKDIVRYRLPAYTAVVACLMVCNVYPWTAITWSMCPLFYFGTVMLAYGCFHWLDQPAPRPLAAVVALWLSVFTMANGILALPIAALLVGYRHCNGQPYAKATLRFLLLSSIFGLAIYIALFNLFDSQVYGAKTLEQSFVNVAGRLVDFLESVGSVPLFPHEYREGKIALGSLILTLLVPLLLSPAARSAPAITGLLLFNLGTIFVTSLFRYSAGGNNAYQVFPAIILACAFVLGSRAISSKRFVPALMLVMALAFNLNALIHNWPLMAQHNREKTAGLQLFLWNGYDRNNEWFGIVEYAALSRNIHRPLQQHHLLPVARSVNALADCPPAAGSAGTLTVHTAPDAFAIALDFPQPATAILLCGAKNYRLATGQRSTLDKQHTISLLLDKRAVDIGTYRVLVETADGIAAFDNPLTVTAIAPYAWRQRDCKGLAAYTRFPSIKPIHDYFCSD